MVITVDYNSTEVNDEGVGSNKGLIYFLYACGILAFLSIFLYKNRKLQMRLTMGCIVFVVIIFVEMYWYSYRMNYFEGGGTSSLELAAAVPFSILVLSILALNRIKKDENLVRSIDRIR
jgi:glucan phosphoethanolaminetransferase (alkaline phosphatase superfamily)